MIKKGFTMIELLVVMAIIAIITGIGMGNYINTQAKTRDAKRKHDLEQIQRALEIFYNDYQRYPDSLPFRSIWQDVDDTIYLKEVPEDPKFPGSFYLYEPRGTNNTGYVLYTRIENEQDSCFTTGGPCLSTGYPAAGPCTTDNLDCNYAISSPNVVP